jgi:aspartate kinase
MLRNREGRSMKRPAVRSPRLMVQKFGGTSVGSVERIRQVAWRALSAQREGYQVVVVVSAMSGETNRLLALAQQMTQVPDRRELDVVASTGEQVAAALTALAIQEAGGQAKSFLGHQIRIFTSPDHSEARIFGIETDLLRDALNLGMIPVIAGFQGITFEGEVTTLGRGGSDTTALALAAALQADTCEIYTDVEGVYSGDPALCDGARKLNSVSYDEMLVLSSQGAKVLHGRSVEIARKYKVDVHVRSSFSDALGTLVSERLEERDLTGVALDRNFVWLQFGYTKGGAAQVLESLSEAQIPVEMFLSLPAREELSFSVRETDAVRVLKVLGKNNPAPTASQASKVSLIGAGLKSDLTVFSRFTRLLSSAEIPLFAVFSHELSLSAWVPRKLGEQALQILHDGFGLNMNFRPQSYLKESPQWTC